MGLDTMLGVGPIIKIGQHELTVKGQIFRHFAEVAAQIKAERPDPFDALRKLSEAYKSDVSLAAGIIETCFYEAKTWNNVSFPEITNYLENVWEGQVMGFWLAVRDNDREKWTLPYFREVFSDECELIVRRDGQGALMEWFEEFRKKIDQASGAGELGNSHGSQPSSTEAVESPPTGNTSSQS